MSILTMSKVRKVFGGLVAVNDVDMTVEKGTIHAVIGPNGAGKTTFFNCITALFPADGGSIRFHDQELIGMPTHSINALGIARTFQNIRLFPYLSALENVKVGTHSQTKTNLFGALWRGASYRNEEREVNEFAMSLLERTGLADKRDSYARNLAYGDQRKLEIARAMASRPEVLLLDEPAAGMNTTETAQLDEFIRSLKSDGYTIVLIEHDMRLVMAIADIITVIDHGVKIAEGVASVVQNNPAVIEAYLGRGAVQA